MVHELASNAAKYGALSVPEGRIAMTWNINAEAGAVPLNWRQNSGLKIVAPTRIGFGSRLIERALARAVDG